MAISLTILQVMNVIHKIKMLIKMTLALQLHLMCGHLLGLNSPNATFLSRFLAGNGLNLFFQM